MARLFVSLTTACCTGMLFQAEGTDDEVSKVFRAAEAFNDTGAWRERGCDGTAELQEDEAAVVAFWRDRTETRARTFKGITRMIREDGDVRRCAAVDLADYLTSLERQAENLLPEAI